MQDHPSLNYSDAFRYANAWSISNHDDITHLIRNPHDFHGTLGSLEFAYDEQTRVLHVWVFVAPGAGPLLSTRAEVKQTIDRVAQDKPSETAGGVFDVRTLEWNKQASARLEPCLWLRLDITSNDSPVEQVVQRFKDLSRTGIVWNRQKLPDALRAYWNTHSAQR